MITVTSPEAAAPSASVAAAFALSFEFPAASADVLLLPDPHAVTDVAANVAAKIVVNTLFTLFAFIIFFLILSFLLIISSFSYTFTR